MNQLLQIKYSMEYNLYFLLLEYLSSNAVNVNVHYIWMETYLC